MDNYVKIYFPPYCLIFLVSNMILSDALPSPISKLRIQHMMTSQIMSHIEYLTHTYCIFLAHFVVETDAKSSHNGGF